VNSERRGEVAVSGIEVPVREKVGLRMFGDRRLESAAVVPKRAVEDQQHRGVAPQM
jgi:hypothetical protein